MIDKSPYKINFEISFSNIAFVFWFILGSKPFLIYLFFQSNPAVGTALTLSFGLGFLFLILIALMQRSKLSGSFLIHKQSLANYALIAYMAWSGLSLLWSKASDTNLAIAYWVSMAAEVLVVYFVCWRGNLERVAYRSLEGIALSASLMAFIALLSGASAGSRLGDADFLHPNSIGNQMAIAALCAIHLTNDKHNATTKKALWVLLTSLLIGTLIQSLSKTAIIAFSLAVLAYIFTSNLKLKSKASILALVAGFTSFFFTYLANYITEYQNLQGGEALETASGRVFLWAETWSMIAANPLIGYGFLSFRDYGPDIFAIKMAQAHNEWLNQWFHFGIVGLTLVGVLYISLFVITLKGRKLFHSAISPKTLSLSLLIYFLIRGLTESSAIGPVFPIPLVLLMLLWMNHEAQQEQELYGIPE